MKKVVLIHGYTSSPKRKKYRIISKELQNLGIEHSIPQMPGGLYPHSGEWIKIIDREVKNLPKPVVLVGHSLGTRAVLLYIDTYKRRVDTVILIAAFNDDYLNNRIRRNGNYTDFFEHPLNIELVKTLANKFIVVHSKDDDSIDCQQGVDISKLIGAELITYENVRHLGGGEKAEQNAAEFLKVIKSSL